ncbi:MAG: iron-sulfur cluster assembly accessory protein [Cardiobacteriaceae bacterium]|nr:iron-sulfur cluster assembly accessory protein [Cardiobacteriaceae bacterium]
MITLSSAARQRLQRQTTKAGQFLVHIDVIRSGCSGFSYTLSLIDTVQTGQRVYADEGFSLVVDEDDIAMLHGVQLDIQKQGLNERLHFNNPNATATCGCGSSFSL